MRIVRPGKITFMPLRTLETRPDVGLHIFQHMAEMNGAIGIGQGTGQQDLSFRGSHEFQFLCAIANYVMPCHRTALLLTRKALADTMRFPQIQNHE